MILIVPSCVPFFQYDPTQFGSVLFGLITLITLGQVPSKMLRRDFSICHQIKPPIQPLPGFPGGKAAEALCLLRPSI
jgi:hypothetical protein